MPTSSSGLNFIRGLSDFWVRFFESTEMVEGLLDGAQVQVGQLYLELMEATLGTSLQYMPLFQKKYWRYLPVREDLLNYVEGPSPTQNRYEVLSSDRYGDASFLVNRVIDPTVALKKNTDFDVVNGAIRLHANPFVTDLGFPVKTVTVKTSSDLTHPFGGDWDSLGMGAKPGDVLRIRYQTGNDHDVPVAAVQGSSLILQAAVETTRTNGLMRSTSLSVMRTPFDSQQLGTPLDGRISEIRLFGLYAASGQTLTGVVDAVDAVVTAVVAPDSLIITNAEGSWVGKKLALRDVAVPANNGIYTITAVIDTTVVVSGAAFTASAWKYAAYVGVSPSGADVGTYIYVTDPDVSANRVYARVSATGGDTLTLDMLGAFGAIDTVQPVRQVTVPDSLGARPTIESAHTFIVPGTFQALPVRLFDHSTDTETYPSGGALIEDVDYIIDYETGLITMFSVWTPEPEFRANYEYLLRVYNISITYRGSWQSATAYSANDTVVYSGKTWIATTSSTSVTPGTTAAWRELPYLFRFDQSFNFRELAVWVPDAKLDVDALYTNFGYLLSFKKPSTEAYRAFLRGVAQLFLRGPSLGRFISAFNVMAELPVVREDGEVLTDFVSGFEALGDSPLVAETGDATLGNFGELIDFEYGSTGLVDAGTSTFTTEDPFYKGAWNSLLTYDQDDTVTVGTTRYRALVDPTVGTFVTSEWLELLPTFFPTDVGGILTVRKPNGDAWTYTLASVSADGRTATISPTPTSDEIELLWQFSHVLVRRRFTVRGPNVTFAFTPDDVGTLVFLEGSREQRNRGPLRVAEVESPRTVYLESDYALIDETGLRFRISRTRESAVITDRHLYNFPVTIPIREEVTDTANFGVLKFKAFEALSSAINITDYVSNEAWWHNITIPTEVLQLFPDNLARRQVSPQLIENIIGALDEAVIGDFGVSVGYDEEKEPGIERTGLARWLGGHWLKLLFPPETPPARLRDVGQYVHIPDAPFNGYYRILDLDHDGTSVKLEGFPPPAAVGRVAPVDFPAAELPPIVYRRTVGFVMMDRFLKYHALRVRIDAPEIFTGEFISDALSLLREAKPAHTYVYLEPLTDFTETIRIKEDFEVAYGPWIDELISYEDFRMKIGSQIRVGEFFAIFDRTVSLSLTAGLNTITPNPSLPYVPDRKFLMFLRFSAGTAGGRPLTAGVNYSIDYSTGTVTIPNADAGSATYSVIILALRVPPSISSPDWWTGVNSGTSGGISWAETPWHVGGSDPLKREPEGIVQPYGQALTEPPIQLLIS